MKTLEMIKGTYPIIKKEFSKDECNKILREAIEESEKIHGDEPVFQSKASQGFMEQGIFGISIYKALIKRMKHEETCIFTQKCFLHNVDIMFKSPILRCFSKSKTLLRISRKIIIKDANSKDNSLGFKYELKSKKKEYLYEFDVLQCPIVQLLKNMIYYF
ncbi:hypothetical protein [Clostridium sporogenes]|uniref:hypothetical protein n=1 Tax=Clostridium sporogenes TaxID=1509 RepID=UPI002238014F|nr:hypothetical protein [Clostridium sporogenes]EKS4342683.1 hypothetical protein [Clostridium botulinum]EKS4395461.1 hypothetical protein [Clostridium botulinum]MCW6077742.1 hypothetical protein [Clostridium sporogenes]